MLQHLLNSVLFNITQGI